MKPAVVVGCSATQGRSRRDRRVAAALRATAGIPTPLLDRQFINRLIRLRTDQLLAEVPSLLAIFPRERRGQTGKRGLSATSRKGDSR